MTTTLTKGHFIEIQTLKLRMIQNFQLTILLLGT